MAVADQFETVQKLYIAFYQRPADFAGREFWAGEVETKGLDSVINAFATSAEATALYGEINNDTIGDVIDAIYQAAFGRAADAEGKAWYVAEFEAGNFTAATIALNVVNGAIDGDAIILGNKVAAADLFTAAVEGVEYDADDITAARDFLAGVTDTVPTQEEVAAVVDEQIAGEEPGEGFTLTEALDTYLGAQDDRADFLKNALDNELVAEEAGAGAKTAEAGDLALALDASVENLDGAIEAVSGTSAFGEAGTSINVREALIADALEDAQTSITAAETALATAQQAFQAQATSIEKRLAANYETAAANLEAAKAERDSAEADAQAAIKAFVAAQAEDDVTIFVTENQQEIRLDDASGAILARFEAFDSTTEQGGRYVIQSNGLGVEGLESVVDTINDALVASDAVNDARADRNEARGDLGITVAEDGTVTTEDNEVTGASAEAAALYNQVIGAKEALAGEQAELIALEAAIADYRELVDLNQQLDDLDTAVTEAREAITDSEEDGGLGINLRDADQNATFNDDLFIFSEDFDGEAIANFGKAGEDKIYFGSDFELVALGDNEITDRVGAADQLEIFWEETSSGLTLYVEAGAEAGRDLNTDEITTIELTGVSFEDVNFSGGFLTAGMPA